MEVNFDLCGGRGSFAVISLVHSHAPASMSLSQIEKLKNPGTQTLFSVR
jgi:hypothetical protein